VPKTIAVYLEVGAKRVFAGALDRPGWARSARDEEAALDALVAYGSRYRRSIGRAADDLTLPGSRSSLRVVERLTGDATTDFGAPGKAPARDSKPLSAVELERLTEVLRASWRAFDRAARSATGTTLTTGPRGGGRALAAIREHVHEADGAYLRSIGGGFDAPPGASADRLVRLQRDALVDAIGSRARGEPPAKPRRTAALWTPRYTIRRSAWHALDHAWEVQDRSRPR